MNGMSSVTEQVKAGPAFTQANLTTKVKPSYDVVIIGAGWAGLTLARQLKMSRPELSIVQLDAATEYKAKVGEATVEMTGHYFMHRLGLANYLYRNHLPKNGLRFLFDSENHDLELHEMSEHGTSNIPPHPAFQLDRARLEEDLVAMNREMGIDILLGARVKDLEIDESIHAAPHLVQFDCPALGESIDPMGQTVSGRWLVDASGKAGLIAKKYKLHHRCDVPQNASTWARFSNIKDIDALGPKEWRRKVNGRFLSTIHFTGEGYWIWVIPLSGGFTSIGVDCDKERMKKRPVKRDEFMAFLKSHKGLADLLEGAQMEDFEAWGQLAYRGEKYMSEHRWATTGFAAMFLDPLFSFGGDMISLFNDGICKTICEDFATEDESEAITKLAQNLPVLNQQAHEFYQRIYSHVNNVTPVLDCGELCSPILAYITATYFLETAWDYMADNFVDLERWQSKSHLRRGYLALEKKLNRQILETAETLNYEGRYFDRNSIGFFESGAEIYRYFVFEMGDKGKDGRRIDLHTKLWASIYLQVTGSRLNLKKFASRNLVQECLNLPQILTKDSFTKADLPDLIQDINAALTQKLIEQSELEFQEGELVASIDEMSFESGDVYIACTKDELTQDEMALLTKQAKALWAQEQEYIHMPFTVPYFLQFCRQTDESIMSDPIQDAEVPTRKVAAERLLAQMQRESQTAGAEELMQLGQEEATETEKAGTC
ncbi:NAD(P)/FAD-dependent oxidoreductase [Marinomonas sp. PE14-40]|uniref:NAD(P)/FAD-dependent oxidoreductase n=1 Tax=Marinomonas sp. PE14-40 TaxID=3060621 RepID=UPI003F662E23